MTDTLTVVQEIYAAFSRGDVPSILERVSPDVSWEHDAPDHGIAWLKPGRGRAHVATFFAVVAEELAIHVFEPHVPFVHGREVIVPIHVELTVKKTGARVRDLELHHWVLDDAQRVVRFRHVADTHAHWLASR